MSNQMPDSHLLAEGLGHRFSVVEVPCSDPHLANGSVPKPPLSNK